MPDYGTYGPRCRLCGQQLSAHSVNLENPDPDAIMGVFPGVNIKGLYCPPVESSSNHED